MPNHAMSIANNMRYEQIQPVGQQIKCPKWQQREDPPTSIGDEISSVLKKFLHSFFFLFTLISFPLYKKPKLHRLCCTDIICDKKHRQAYVLWTSGKLHGESLASFPHFILIYSILFSFLLSSLFFLTLLVLDNGLHRRSRPSLQDCSSLLSQIGRATDPRQTLFSLVV